MPVCSHCHKNTRDPPRTCCWWHWDRIFGDDFHKPRQGFRARLRAFRMVLEDPGPVYELPKSRAAIWSERPGGEPMPHYRIRKPFFTPLRTYRRNPSWGMEAEQAREKYATDPDYRDSRLERNSRWQRENRDRSNEYQRAYYEKNRAKLQAQQRENYWKNRADRLAKAKARREAHPQEATPDGICRANQAREVSA